MRFWRAFHRRLHVNRTECQSFRYIRHRHAVFKHNGVNHWALKTRNAKAVLSVNVDLAASPTGYSPLKQQGGLGHGEGGDGDTNGTGGFSEGAVMAGETTDATNNAIQQSIVGVYGR